MKITRDNYEVFFLDFLEGNLKVDQIDQFLDFLNQNPDLKEELQLFESTNIPEENIIFSGKQKLYKSYPDQLIGEQNTIIAYLEDDLNSEDRILFENQLTHNSELNKEYVLFSKTRMVPDQSVTFPDKNKIHRKSGSKVLLTWMTSIAAMLLMAYGINSVFHSEIKTIRDNKIQPIAEYSPKQITEPKITEPLSKSVSPEHRKVVKVKHKVIPIPVPSIQGQSPNATEAILAENADLARRETEVINEIALRQDPLEVNSEVKQLAISAPDPIGGVKSEPKVVSLDEFLVNRAKQVSAEGLLSVQKIAHAGLDAATELAGDRLSFVEKIGKIEKIRFESKLLAFSIPLKKK